MRIWRWIFVGYTTVAAIGACSVADAAVSTRMYWETFAKRGSTLITSPTFQRPTAEEAARACTDYVNSRDATLTATNVFECGPPKQVFIKTYTADPVVCTAPLPDVRTIVCPAPTVGSWRSTPSWSPTCTLIWDPVTTPAGACVTPVEPLPAPATLTTATTSATNVRLAWSLVTGALAYDVEYCRGAGCTNFARLRCATSSPMDHALPVDATAEYRVRASRDVACGTGDGNLGTWSSPVRGTTVPVVEPPPTGCVGRSCTFSWEYSHAGAEGFRLHYGRSTGALTGTVQVNGADVRRGVIEFPDAGAWFVGVLAFGGGNSSGLSNVEPVTVP